MSESSMDAFPSEQSSCQLADVIARLNIGDELFWRPDRLVPFEHWVGHIPFVFWLVKALQPRRIVELGTHRGNSYCAMCQAVSALGLSTRAFAVDTWRGDLHMGSEAGLLEEVQAYHDPRYSHFSTLMPMAFDEARPHFEDGSIDLFHIDGTHLYEVVRHDFEHWKAALSRRAVVLFHDTAVRRDQYGVWQLWRELAAEYPSFEFTHSYGLGVLGVGIEQAPLLRTLFSIGENEADAYQVRSLFASRGDAQWWRLKTEDAHRELGRLQEAATSRETELLSQLEGERGAAQARIAGLEAEKRSACSQIAELSQQIETEKKSARDQIAGLEAEKRSARNQLAELSQQIEAETKSREVRESALRGALKAERDAAYQARLEGEEAKTTAAAERVHLRTIETKLHAIEASTVWRMVRPVTVALNYVPPRYRRLGRGAIKASWWSLTGQLPARVRSRRARLTAATALPPPTSSIGETAAADPVSVSSLGANGRPAPAAVTLPNLQTCRVAVPQARLAVVLHVHFADLLPELEQALSVIPEAFDLYVSVTELAGEWVAADIRARYPRAHVYVFPNRGRDILPFLAFVQTGVLSNYKAVLKLHTKRSLHEADGDAWRRKLVNGVLGSRDRVGCILAAFENDPDLGIVVADGNVYGADPGHWRDTRNSVLRLGDRIGIRDIPAEARFPAGSIYWIRPFLLRALAGMKVSAADFEPEPIRIDGTTAHAVERLVGLVCQDAGMKIENASAVRGLPLWAKTESPNLHLIAYYLPQFHPIEENDRWWGKGFTEWTNVTRATPSFLNHRQPRLPGDLGFYDLRLAEAREAQAALARQYGVGAFCYYYYWFDGRGILRQPLDEMLLSGKPDFPFLICWANEPWTRNWDGGSREVLLSQTYQEDWPEAFARDIAPLLRDPRYFRLEGLPVLLVYRVMHVPERHTAFDRLRAELRRLDVGEVHLGGGWVGFTEDDPLPSDPSQVGLDSFFEFPPHRLPAAEITGEVQGLDPEFTGHVYSYDSAIDSSLAETAAEERHRAVMLGWDNTARNMRGGHMFHGATPVKFRRWLRGLLRLECSRPGPANRLIFINGWNEWAEGAYLEPDRDFGHGWLEAVASATAEPILPPDHRLNEGEANVESAAVGSDEEWLQQLIAKAEGHAAPEIEALPPFPAPAWQAQFVGTTNGHAMREAFAFYKLLKAEAAAHGLSISRNTRVLDFGCGWGRFTRLWMKDIPATRLHGIDVNPDLIGFCRISGLAAGFETVPPLGPTPFEADSFELIFAYSVFSHLAEPTYSAWMTEFGRILRPGGIIVFTTQALRFLENTVALRSNPEHELTAWEKSLRTAFPDITQTIADYNAGRYVFAATGGGDHLPSSFYGEAAIPSSYLERTAHHFDLRLSKFIDEPSVCPQAVAVMSKPIS